MHDQLFFNQRTWSESNRAARMFRDYARAVVRESGGWFAQITDDQILSAQKLLAQREGVFCEPASAASLAGLIQDLEAGRIPEQSVIVCTLTGHGLKDPDIAIEQSTQPLSVEAEMDAVRSIILDSMARQD